MSGAGPHFQLELQDLLDNRLAEPQRSAVVAHVAGCAQCRSELDALKTARDGVRALPNEAAPHDLRARVLAALDAVDRERSAPPSRARASRRARIAVSGVILAAAAILFFFVRRPSSYVEPATIAADFVEYETGALDLEIRASLPAAVEGYFRRRGIAFPTRVFDLGMMGFHVVGGAILGAPARGRALFVYRGPDNVEIVCQMYVGSVASLPPASEVREHNGITFHVYRDGNLTIVFWQEGDVICVLTSDAKPETVIDLAFAKAVKI